MSETAKLVLELDESDVVSGGKKAEKALDSLKKSGDKVGKGFGNFKNALGSIGDSAKDAALDGLGPLKGVVAGLSGPMLAAGLAIGGTVVAVGALAIGVKKLVDSMKPLQDAQRVFRLKDGEEGVKTLDRIRKFGSDAGIGLEATTAAATKLGAAFKSTKAAEEAFKVIADLKAIVPTVEVGQLTDEFVELAAKSTIGAGDLEKFKKMLGSTAPTFDQIAKVTGKTAAEVAEMVKKGELGSADFARALRLAATEAAKTGEAGAAALKFAESDPSAQINKLGDSLTLLKEKFALALLGPDGGGAGFKKLADAIGSLTSNKELITFVENMGKVFAVLGSVIFDGVIAAFKFLKPFIDPILQAFSKITANTEAMAIVFKVLGIAIGIVVAPFYLVVAAVGAVIYAGSQLINNWTAVVDFFAGLPGMIAGFVGQVLTSVANFVASVPGMVTNLLANIGSAFTNFIGLGPDLGRNLVQGFVNGILAMATAPVDAVRNIAQRALGAFKSTLGISSPSKEFAKAGGFVAEGFAQGVDDATSDAAAATSAMAGASLGATPTAGMGGGVTIDLSGMQFTFGSGVSQPQAIAAVVRQSVRSEVIAALQQAGLAAGGAT